MVGTWLGEIRSCSSLTVLPDTAWVLLNKIYQPFFTSLYVRIFGEVVEQRAEADRGRLEPCCEEERPLQR